MKSYSVNELSSILNGILLGTTQEQITGAEQLNKAQSNHISFIGNKKYEKLWDTSKASVAVVNKDIAIEPGDNRAFIQVADADLAMSQVLELFAPPMPEFAVAIHPTAVIDDTAKIGNGVKIGAGSGVTGDVEAGKTMLGYPALEARDTLKQWAIMKRLLNESKK